MKTPRLTSLMSTNRFVLKKYTGTRGEQLVFFHADMVGFFRECEIKKPTLILKSLILASGFWDGAKILAYKHAMKKISNSREWHTEICHTGVEFVSLFQEMLRNAYTN